MDRTKFGDAMQDSKGAVVLLTGPSGVGKDTIIRELVRREPSLEWVPKYTNRQLRPGETGRIHKENEELARMERDGSVTITTNSFGIKIAESISDVESVLARGRIPIFDFNISNVSAYRTKIGARVFTVYVLPPSIDELERRLKEAGRPGRLEAGIFELSEVESGKFVDCIDYSIINENVGDAASAIASAIRVLRQ